MLEGEFSVRAGSSDKGVFESTFVDFVEEALTTDFEIFQVTHSFVLLTISFVASHVVTAIFPWAFHHWCICWWNIWPGGGVWFWSIWSL